MSVTRAWISWCSASKVVVDSTHTSRPSRRIMRWVRARATPGMLTTMAARELAAVRSSGWMDCMSRVPTSSSGAQPRRSRVVPAALVTRPSRASRISAHDAGAPGTGSSSPDGGASCSGTSSSGEIITTITRRSVSTRLANRSRLRIHLPSTNWSPSAWVSTPGSSRAARHAFTTDSRSSTWKVRSCDASGVSLGACSATWPSTAIARATSSGAPSHRTVDPAAIVRRRSRSQIGSRSGMVRSGPRAGGPRGIPIVGGCGASARTTPAGTRRT